MGNSKHSRQNQVGIKSAGLVVLFMIGLLIFLSRNSAIGSNINIAPKEIQKSTKPTIINRKTIPDNNLIIKEPQKLAAPQPSEERAFRQEVVSSTNEPKCYKEDLGLYGFGCWGKIVFDCHSSHSVTIGKIDVHYCSKTMVGTCTIYDSFEDQKCNIDMFLDPDSGDVVRLSVSYKDLELHPEEDIEINIVDNEQFISWAKSRAKQI